MQYPALQTFAQAKGISPAQAVYRLAQFAGVTPLSGTTKEVHMKADLAVEKVEINSEDQKNLDAVLRWMGLQRN